MCLSHCGCMHDVSKGYSALTVPVTGWRVFPGRFLSFKPWAQIQKSFFLLFFFFLCHLLITPRHSWLEKRGFQFAKIRCLFGFAFFEHTACPRMGGFPNPPPSGTPVCHCEQCWAWWEAEPQQLLQDSLGWAQDEISNTLQAQRDCSTQPGLVQKILVFLLTSFISAGRAKGILGTGNRW